MKTIKKMFTASRLFVLSILMMPGIASAALPAVSNTTRNTAQGNYIQLFQNYAYDIFIVVGLLVGTIAFIRVVTNLIATYGEIQNGRKTWGDMGAQAVFGVLLLVFTVFLLTEAATVL